MPKKHRFSMPIPIDRIKALADDPRYVHLFWDFPREHPIRQHRGSGIIVLVNPKRRRAYVFAGRTQTVHAAATALIARLRHVMRSRNGDVFLQQPTPEKFIPLNGSLQVPHQLVTDWDVDTPDGFTWLLADPFPERYDREFGWDKQGKSAYKAEIRARKERVVATLERNGWQLYNPPAIRGITRRGARLAWNEMDAGIAEEHAEFLRNHLEWQDLHTYGSPGLKPEHDPDDTDVQRAYARYQNMRGLPVPKPGDPMQGHKIGDRYIFHLTEGQLSVNCPLDCPRRTHRQVDNALADRSTIKPRAPRAD